jgi:hypothetical protein
VDSRSKGTRLSVLESFCISGEALVMRWIGSGGVDVPSRDCDWRTSRVRIICWAAPMQMRTRERAPPEEGIWIGRGDASLRCQKWKRRGRVARMIH